MSKKAVTLEALHVMSSRRKMRFFSTATKEQIEQFTEPCMGEAHSPEVGGMIDYCMRCMSVRWGRMLKSV